MAATFGRIKFFENWVSYSEKVPYGSKILSKSLYLAWFLRYKDFCVLHFWKKIRKIQNDRHFCQVKYLLKLGKASLHRYPVGQKFCQNPTSKFLFYEENGFKKYSYISIVLYEYLMSLYFQFCALHFLSKIRKLNMTHIFGEEKICGKLARVVCLDTLWVEKFDEITLSHTVKEIQAVLCFTR